MILEKEVIEKAVNWWAEKVTANQPHSNGDNGHTSLWIMERNLRWRMRSKSPV